MSNRPLILEDFSSVGSIAAQEAHDGERLEAERLDSFDKGYSAGWKEATAAAERAAEEQGLALASRHEELAFTFHEARAHVMRSLNPLLEAIAHTIVPRTLHETLGARLSELFQDLASEASEAEVRILTAADEADAVAASLEGRVRFPMSIREDDTLPPGTLQIRMGEIARELDLTAIETALADALGALDTLNEETLSHG